MINLKTLWAILIKQIHQIVTSRNNGRELIILLTVLTGMLVTPLLFGNNEQLVKELVTIIHSYNEPSVWTYYYAKYTLSFVKSFIVLVVCFLAIMVTESKRLTYGLTTFLLLSMSMDLASIISSDLYRLLEPYRYDNYYNFKDLYTTFEVLCVLYTFTNWTIDFIKTTVDNYFNRHDDVCNSSSIESILAHKKKKV